MDNQQKITELCDKIRFGPREYRVVMYNPTETVRIGLGAVVSTPKEAVSTAVRAFFDVFHKGKTIVLELQNRNELVKVSLPVSHPVRYAEWVRRYPMEALAAIGKEDG